MLEQAFNQLGSNFSARFVLGQFLPVFAMLCLNLLLFALYHWGWSHSLDFATQTLGISDFATAIGVVASASASIAFTLGPLLNALRRILEGALLPEMLRNRLIDSNRAWADRQISEIDAINSFAKLLDMARRKIEALSPFPPEPIVTPPVQPVGSWIERLIARLFSDVDGAQPEPAADSQPATLPSAIPVAQHLSTLEELVNGMERTMTAAETAATRSRWDEQIGEAAQTALCEARDALIAAADAFGSDWPPAFQDLRGRFLGTSRRLLGLIMRLASDRTTTLNLQYVPADPRPTRFGNLRAALENYSFVVYGVGFDYLWPRVQLVIDKDDANAIALSEARTQLDYTLIAMLLVLLTCTFWVVTLAWSDDHVIRFLTVGVLSWLLFHLFYRIALEAQRGLTEVTKAIIDQYRFSLLTALGSTRPADNDAERRQWRALADVAAGGRPSPPLTFEPKG